MIVIVAMLAVVLIARLLAILADAERTSMETVVGALRSAIGMTVAEAIVTQDVRGLAALEGSNPMKRLAQVPSNYLGAFDNPEPASYEDGNWYFDNKAGELVYLVRHRERFNSGSDNPPRARFVVRVVYSDRNGNGRFDSGIDALEGLQLVPVEPYKWTR